jgi:hypothetical protein
VQKLKTIGKVDSLVRKRPAQNRIAVNQEELRSGIISNKVDVVSVEIEFCFLESFILLFVLFRKVLVLFP